MGKMVHLALKQVMAQVHYVDNISTDFTVDKENKIFNVEGEELEYSLSGNTLTVSGDGFGTVKLERE